MPLGTSFCFYLFTDYFKPNAFNNSGNYKAIHTVLS